ncbi:MAG: hypothetical protein H0M93_04990, partial [Methanophagales archaeon]|nr:hypothetical protein [Methanophagales archaeon]
LHKTIRKRAIDRDISMKAYILELINKGLGVEEVEGLGGDKKGTQFYFIIPCIEISRNFYLSRVYI